MTTFNVTIPNDKTSLFLEFLELIGGKFEIDEQDFELSEEVKKMLDQRLKTNRSEYVSAREALDSLRQKHGI